MNLNSRKHISSDHKNRKNHNWLVYNIGDKFLFKFKDYYRGDLYDLGCGDGSYKNFFLKFVENYIGVDWASSIHNVNANIVGDLNKKLPIDSEVAGTVVSLSVMEHLHSPQIMLDEAFRILKEDGYFVLQVPWQWWIHEAPYDYFRYTPYALRLMLTKAGFSSIEIMATSGFFTTWLLKFNYFSLRFINRQFRLLRGILKMIFIPIWFINQILAPLLDKLDDNWENETQGFYVLAKK